MREPTTHDYTKRCWGHDLAVLAVHDDGKRLDASGWGVGIRTGDWMLLENHGQQTRYRVKDITYACAPADMWSAILLFDPRSPEELERAAASHRLTTHALPTTAPIESLPRGVAMSVEKSDYDQTLTLHVSVSHAALALALAKSPVLKEMSRRLNHSVSANWTEVLAFFNGVVNGGMGVEAGLGIGYSSDTLRDARNTEESSST